ncbi:MAG: glycoside hydrolase family 3 C-terminal domain-containing protein [Lachnospiraceae bacterium]|nr:glycoside hydrolase family 3 C-terminal domain-containing protein [Lachnospiraceae bacterium]
MNQKYKSEESRIALAREIAGEAMVLLKNEDRVLPLPLGKCVALLGRTQLHTIIGGGGSGASRCDNPLGIPEELQKAGLRLSGPLYDFYQEIKNEEASTSTDPFGGGDGDSFFKNIEGLVASGMIYELFGRYTPAVPEELPEEALFSAAALETDTAVVIIGRQTGGEECDRRVDDDYELQESEIELLRLTCAHFPKVVAVLNVNGMMDIPALEKFPEVKAILFMGTSGEQAAGALADILTGKISPSGKLNQTAALSYEDYPTAKHFSSNKDKPETILQYKDYGLSAEQNGSIGFDMSPVTVYEEDIYMGYRYFDSFEKPVAYPFGFGLSYAEFVIVPAEAAVSDGVFSADVCVKNLSAEYAGKEALQLYVHAPFGKLKKPEKELQAIAKTKCIAPGGESLVRLEFPLSELASFDEETKEYVIEAGDYTVLVGNSSKNVSPCAVLKVSEPIVTRSVTADIGMLPCNKGKVKLLKPEQEIPVTAEALQDAGTEMPGGLPVISLSSADVVTDWPVYQAYDFSAGLVPSILQDVLDGKVTMEQFVAQMSAEELAVLSCGYGPGLPFGGIAAKGAPPTIYYEDGSPIGTTTRPDLGFGYSNPAIEKYGIPTRSYKDGPASVGKTAWPTGMMLACTFNPELAYEFGSACGAEAEELGIDSWLAPGMNLVRNPIEGRAFEYFGEDPFLSGIMGTKVTLGAMENNAVTTCPKHFALNEQETYRRGKTTRNIDAADSVVSARAARELYLKPFEMVLTQAKPTTLMTSFNKLNGSFAGGNRVLCTEILRGEWGFTGVVVTDWGDMDIVVDGADAVAAGNDVIMPGGPPVIAQVLQGYAEGRVSLNEMREAAAHLMNFVK